MILSNSLETRLFRLNPPFTGKVALYATCQLADVELLAAYYGFDLVGHMAARDKIPDCRIDGLNAIFTTSDNVTVEFSPNEYGLCFRTVLYPVHKWRKANYNYLQILICVIEELCHMLWEIRDETEVCYKVFEIIKIKYPSLKFSELYSIDENPR